MTSDEQEILRITQEECAEVIQAVSKIFRFGFDTEWNGETNREHLEEEVGDLLAMIYILQSANIINEEKVIEASEAKIEKLKKWSRISLVIDK